MKTHWQQVFFALIFASPVAATTSPAASTSTGPDDFNRLDYQLVGAATLAKEVCSAVFVSGFDAEQHLQQNAKFWLHGDDRSLVSDVEIDRQSGLVSLHVADSMGRALYLGARGCVALGPENTLPDIAVSPLRPVTLNHTINWPMGDAGIPAPLPKRLDASTLANALEAAFAEDAFTTAFLVVHNGKVIAEQYDRGVTPTTRLPGWSIAKTLQATLVGRLQEQDRIKLFAPVPIKAWSAPSDKRKDTTLADLLRMSAPIDCGNTENWHDQQAWPTAGYPESFYVFSGPADAYEYAVQRPPLPPETPRGVYTNCQPMIIGKVLQQTLAESKQTLDQYAQEALYDPLGMSPVVIEPDRKGNPLTAGYALATARDWTRLGLLYLNEGVWEGERLLSPEFLAFVRAPAPHWQEPVYGGQVWLNAKACLFGQCDAYQFNGIEGQRVVIFPSLDLVIARFGFGQGDIPNPDPTARRPAIEAMNQAIQLIVDDLANQPTAEEQAVEQTLETFFSALSMGDQERFESVLAEDFRLLEDGEVWSADYTFQRAARPNREERWTITQARVNVIGEVAYIDYRNTGSFTEAEKRAVYEWLESAVLVKQDGRWRITLLHSTPIKQLKH